MLVRNLTHLFMCDDAPQYRRLFQSNFIPTFLFKEGHYYRICTIMGLRLRTLSERVLPPQGLPTDQCRSLLQLVGGYCGAPCARPSFAAWAEMALQLLCLALHH